MCLTQVDIYQTGQPLQVLDAKELKLQNDEKLCTTFHLISKTAGAMPRSCEVVFCALLSKLRCTTVHGTVFNIEAKLSGNNRVASLICIAMSVL